MERLSGLDATFLYFETPTNHMHVSAIFVLDPSTMPGGYSFAKIKEFVRARLAKVPQFRRRLATVPFNLHHPVWFDDPTFDLDDHVRRVGIPAPGGARELAELAGDLTSIPLDRNRPLWELWVCEGLEGGLVAVVTKMHHATVDGVSGANLMVHLFDLDPVPAEEPVEGEFEPEQHPSNLDLVRYALVSRLRRPKWFQLAWMIPSTIAATVRVMRHALDKARSSGAAPLTAPRTSFNTAISPRRSVAFVSLPLADVRAVKNAFGVTVNDVVLATCAGALRRYLERRGELPDKPLVATCPVSVHSAETDAQVGTNKVSAMFVSLPTNVEDPVERVEAIHVSTSGAKEIHHAVGAHTLMQWTELAAPNTFAQAARLYSSMKLANRHPVIHNLVVSNVPGPSFPLYFAGARMVAMNPLGPVFDGAGLNVTVISYLDQMSFGFMADRESVRHVWQLADDVEAAFAELAKVAQTRPPPAD